MEDIHAQLLSNEKIKKYKNTRLSNIRVNCKVLFLSKFSRMFPQCCISARLISSLLNTNANYVAKTFKTSEMCFHVNIGCKFF